MVKPVSIHRKKDLHHARVFAERIRLKLKAPPSAVTDAVVERLADMLQEERTWRQNEVARCRAQMAALHAEVNAEFAQIRALIEALKAFTCARKALNEALAVHGRGPAARGQQATSR
jgi:chromosome condensin MukBEF complex kleisin-like MukF subunit